MVVYQYAPAVIGQHTGKGESTKHGSIVFYRGIR